MIKGHVQIDIHNHNSGFTERFEQDNMVTDALKYVIPNYIGANNRPDEDNGVMPLATRALGGLMLFDGPLTEDAKNIHFPSEAHLVAYAGQGVNTSGIRAGSKNVAESKELGTGYQSVWDFSTAQANGTIESLALTNYWGDPLCLRNTNISMHAIMDEDGDRYSGFYPYPICYDVAKQEVYYAISGKHDRSYDSDKRTYTHHYEWSIRKNYVPTNKYKVCDNGDESHYPENVASCSIDWETSYYDDLYPYSRFFNGYDGYAYMVFCRGNTEGDASITYWRMKIDDFSFKIDGPTTINVANCALIGSMSSEIVNKGYLYIGGASRRYIFVINLADPVQVRTVDLGDGNWYCDGSWAAFSGLYNGGIRFIFGTNGPSSGRYNYSRAVLYPDGLVIVTDVFQEDTSLSAYDWHIRPCVEADNLLLWGGDTSWMYACAYQANNYLGTICNLSSAVQKTAASSMKVTYTLTDVDETNEETTS